MRKNLILIILSIFLSGCASMSTTGTKLVNQMYEKNYLTDEEKNILINKFVSDNPYLLESQNYEGIYDYLKSYIQNSNLIDDKFSEDEYIALVKFRAYTYEEWQNKRYKGQLFGMTLQSVTMGGGQARSKPSSPNSLINSEMPKQLYNNEGSPVGWVSNNNVHTYESGYVGSINNNQVITSNGVVGWTQDNNIYTPDDGYVGHIQGN